MKTLLGILACAAVTCCAAEQPSITPTSRPAATLIVRPQQPEPSPAYVLGPGDQIVVRVANFDEISDKPIRIDLNGSAQLPALGSVRFAGLTTAQAAAELKQRLQNYLLHPDVSVSVAEFASQPVSIIGAVKHPGMQQVQGNRTVVDMLSLAGGLDADAGLDLKITRRLEYGRIPLPDAADDSTGKYSVAQVDLTSIISAKDPKENVLVKPYDVISVPRAETVYVIGNVNKAGGFLLGDHENMTVLLALSMAGGLDHLAKPQNARILRRDPEVDSRKIIPVNLKQILEGKISDMPMEPEDILFVPDNVPKKAALRALDAAIQTGTGVVIWGRY